ncbi:MAG: hypothetical protein ACFFER_16125 [Candidatus Thorarchaeota archaeon]
MIIRKTCESSQGELETTDQMIKKDEKQMGCGSATRKRKSKITVRNPERIDRGISAMLMPRVPQKCFNCGASIHTERVNWIGPDKIECPYCGQALAVDFEKVA